MNNFANAVAREVENFQLSLTKSNANDELTERLTPLIDRPDVDILEFIESDRFLNQKNIYPRSKWILDVVLNPKRHLDVFENYGYDPHDLPEDGFDEVILVLGMKSAKTNATSLLLSYKLYQLLCDLNPCKTYGFIESQQIFLRNFATSSQQSKDTVFTRSIGIISSSPWFQKYVYILEDLDLFKDNTGELKFEHTNITFRSMHTRMGGIVGVTSFFEACDEIAKFSGEGGSYSGDNIWEAAQSVTKPFKGRAVKVALSSPEYSGDTIFSLARQSEYYIHSKDIEEKDPLFSNEEDKYAEEKIKRRIAFRFPTWEMNPTLPFESFKSEFITDESRAWKNFGTVFGSKIESFFKNHWKLEKMMSKGVEYPLEDDKSFKPWFRDNSGAEYYIAGDPGQGRPARFGLSLGRLDHKIYVDPEGNNYEAPCVVISLTIGFEPEEETGEVNFIEIENFIWELCDLFNVKKIYFDKWQNILLRQRLSNRGYEVEDHVVDLDDYEELASLIREERIDCARYDLLLQELKRIQKKRNKIIPGEKFTKDCADTVASLASNMLSNRVDLDEKKKKKRKRITPIRARGLM